MERPEIVTTGLEDLRNKLRSFVDAATNGTHTVVRRHSRPVAVLVPVDWYVEHGGDVGPIPVTEPPRP